MRVTYAVLQRHHGIQIVLERELHAIFVRYYMNHNCCGVSVAFWRWKRKLIAIIRNEHKKNTYANPLRSLQK